MVLSAPTGAGKTALTLELNPDIFEIVSFDSRQVYKELQIGTSKPSLLERNCIPHHLIDILEPNEKISAREFVNLANHSVGNILSRKKIPILTCGTGFYLKAFLYGMFEFPEVSPETKKIISQLSREEKLSQLQIQDPIRFQELNPNDIYRIERALEIALEGGKWHDYSTPSGGYLQNLSVEWIPLYIDTPRDVLYKRINLRSESMIQNGLLTETKNVMENYGEDCFALNSLGYNFAVEIIHGKITLECLKEKFSQSHRNYAKKQITWFKKETFLKPVLWNEALSLLKKIEIQG